MSMQRHVTVKQTSCYHCGENCGNHPIAAHEKYFCCEGCKMVYEIINQNGLCDYYAIAQNPGSSQKITARKDKFIFLEDEKIRQSLISFPDEAQTYVTFYLPQMHFSSCLWLLENLHRLNENTVTIKVNFTRKEVDIIFNHKKVSLKVVAETLCSIGYEPYISFSDMNKVKPKVSRSKIYKLGVAGFCLPTLCCSAFLNI